MTPTDRYVAGFCDRCRAVGGLDPSSVVELPGAAGFLPTAADPRLRLVVVRDDAYDTLAAALPSASSGNVTVFDGAPRSAQLVAGRGEWRAERATAMAHGDLATIRDHPLPAGLTLRGVHRVEGDDPLDVPLREAVAVVARNAAADGDDDHGGLTDHLASLPTATRLLAAVDDRGAVCATSGYGTYGSTAHVFFVNTDAACRGRGIGTAMTGAALVAAREAGARHAYLDASGIGRGLYERLGFEVAAPTTRFWLPE